MVSNREKENYYNYFFTKYLRQCNITELAHKYARTELNKLLKG